MVRSCSLTEEEPREREVTRGSRRGPAFSCEVATWPGASSASPRRSSHDSRPYRSYQFGDFTRGLFSGWGASKPTPQELPEAGRQLFVKALDDQPAEAPAPPAAAALPRRESEQEARLKLELRRMKMENERLRLEACPSPFHSPRPTTRTPGTEHGATSIRWCRESPCERASERISSMRGRGLDCARSSLRAEEDEGVSTPPPAGMHAPTSHRPRAVPRSSPVARRRSDPRSLHPRDVEPRPSSTRLPLARNNVARKAPRTPIRRPLVRARHNSGPGRSDETSP